MLRRPFALAIRLVAEQHARGCGVAMRPVIPGVGPQSPSAGATPARIEHRQRRVVGEQPVRCHDVGGQPLMQRLQPPAGGPDPAHQGGSADLQAVPG